MFPVVQFKWLPVLHYFIGYPVDNFCKNFNSIGTCLSWFIHICVIQTPMLFLSVNPKEYVCFSFWGSSLQQYFDSTGFWHGSILPPNFFSATGSFNSGKIWQHYFEYLITFFSIRFWIIVAIWLYSPLSEMNFGGYQLGTFHPLFRNVEKEISDYVAFNTQGKKKQISKSHLSLNEGWH